MGVLELVVQLNVVFFIVIIIIFFCRWFSAVIAATGGAFLPGEKKIYVEWINLKKYQRQHAWWRALLSQHATFSQGINPSISMMIGFCFPTLYFGPCFFYFHPSRLFFCSNRVRKPILIKTYKSYTYISCVCIFVPKTKKLKNEIPQIMTHPYLCSKNAN